MALRFGFGSLGNRPEEIIELARHGERLGWHRIWFGEHVAQPDAQRSRYPYGEVPLTLTTIDYLDPLIQAAAIASATATIEIATSIFLLPLYHPIFIARALSTLQPIAENRFIFGVGVGWMPEEFEALGVDFNRRGRRMDEALRFLRSAQGGGVVSHEGEEFSFGALTITHRSVSVPLVIGGRSEPALRRAARYGDGWVSTPDIEVDEVLRNRETIEKHRREFGTQDREFTYYIRLARPDPELVAAFAAEGFTDFNVGAVDLFPRAQVASMSLEQKAGALERVAVQLGISQPEVPVLNDLD
jgi:probable F420-dependent oxidoreductase